MANATKLNRFRDFDRLFTPTNLIATLIGSGLAFILAFAPDLFLKLGGYGPPFSLSLSIGIVIITSVYTRNIASSSIVALVAGLGIVSPRGDSVEWALGYIFILLLLSLSLGLLADRLRIVLSWVKFYLYSSLIFTIVFFTFSITSQSQLYRYRNQDIRVGIDMGKVGGVPIFDLAVIGFIVAFIALIRFLTSGQLALDEGSAKKYKAFGVVFFLIGQVITLLTLLVYWKGIPQRIMDEIANNPKHLRTIQDLFSHRGSGPYYAIIKDPMSIYATMALTTMFTAVGISLWIIGSHGGNLEGMKGGSHIALLSAPIGFFIFMVAGAYQLQNILRPDGFYFAYELFPVYATMIWAVLYYNQIFAWLVLNAIEKIMPTK